MIYCTMYVKQSEALRPYQSLSCDVSQIASIASILSHLYATYILFCNNVILYQCMVPFHIGIFHRQT